MGLKKDNISWLFFMASDSLFMERKYDTVTNGQKAYLLDAVRQYVF